MKKVRILSVILFLCMLNGIAACSFLSPIRDFSDMENRTLFQKPKLTEKLTKKLFYPEIIKENMRNIFPTKFFLEILG